MRRGWLTAALVFLGVFGGTAYMAVKLPLLDALGPGPGFFPLILAALGAALSLALIAQRIRQPAAAALGAQEDKPEDLMPDRAALGRIGGVLLLLAAAFFALDPIGYRLTALAFVALVLVALGARNIPVIAIVSVALSFGVFHVFFYWLKVPLPIGGFGL